MSFFRENKVLFAIIGVVFIVCAVTCGIRWNVELHAKTVDYVYDYEELTKLADQSDHDVTWWMKKFRDMGLKKAGLQEESLDSLEKDDRGVESKLLYDVKSDADWREHYPQSVLDVIDARSKDDYDVIVKIDNQEMYQFVSRAFKARFGSSKSVAVPVDDGGYIFIDGDVDDTLYGEDTKLTKTDGDGFKSIQNMSGSMIQYVNLGMLPEKVKQIQDAGVQVVPRTLAYKGWNGTKFAKDMTAQYKALLGKAPQYMILASEAVPGNDDGTAYLSDYIKKNHVVIGAVETTNQRKNISPDGMTNLIQSSGYNVARVFSVWNYIQYRYKYYGYDSYQEIENSLFRPVIERNVRIIYFKPMKYKDDDYRYITNVKSYQNMISDLNSRFAEHGFTVGDASVMKNITVPLAVKILSGIAAVAAAVIALFALFPMKSRRWKYGLFIFGSVCVAGAYFVAPNTSLKLMTLAAAVFVTCITVIWFMRYALQTKERLGTDAGVLRILPRSAAALAVTVVMGLISACIMCAPLSSTDYMIEMDVFHGVKAAQVAVIAFFMLLFFAWYGYIWGSKKEPGITGRDVTGILKWKIEIWVVIVMIAMAAVGYVYLSRTGNSSSVSASNMELMMRSLLENKLYARPRTKEFLAAFPCAMLFIYAMVRGSRLLSFIFGTVATIGFTSVVNTFMHIRSPLELGVARTGYSFLFGLIIGAVCVIVLDLIWRGCTKMKDRYAGNGGTAAEKETADA